VELPRLQPLYEQYRDQGFEIVAIEYRRDTDRAKTFIDENKLTYTFLENGEDDAEVVRSVFEVQGFPTSYLVDRDGRILYYHLGFDEGDEVKLGHEIESVLGG
jgi:thiol-disulfide isomerase/thioredoxin